MQATLLHSYKGGSGKTMLSINLANLLVNEYNASVLLIEGDIFGPLYTETFTENKPDLFFNQYIKDDSNKLQQYIYSTNAGFDLIYASPKFETSDFIHMEEYEKFLKRSKAIRQEFKDSGYDHIILDLAPGVNFLAIGSILFADRIVVVLRPDQNSFNGTLNLLETVYANIFRSHKRDFHLVFNQIPQYEGFNQIIDKWKFLISQKFSYISKFIEMGFNGQTSYNFIKNNIVLPEKDPTLKEIKNLAHEIVDNAHFGK